MEKNLRIKQGKRLLAQHPDIKVLWVCADGTAFDRKPLADEYAGKIGVAELVEVKAGTDEPEAELAEKPAAEPQKPVEEKGSKKGAKTK